jgi:hypothetical protein
MTERNTNNSENNDTPQLGPIGTVIWEEALSPALDTAKTAAKTAIVVVGGATFGAAAIVSGILFFKR